MSKLEKLIAELCPDGIEYKAVGDICKITRGRVISKKYIRDNKGSYPVYSSQTENDGVLGEIATFDYKGEYLTWTTDGANAGSVFYRNGKFSITNVCGLLEPINKKNTLVRYLYFVLQVTANKYVNKGMGNPKLMSNIMAKIKIPLPPLPVQQEIVRILDSFTELTTELTTELDARKKQYEYYRNELLTFGDEVDWSTLGDVAEITAGGDLPSNYIKGQKKPTKSHPYPIYSNGTGDEALYGFTDNYKIGRKAVTVSARGTIGYHEVRVGKFTPIVRLITLVPDNNKVMTKYLNYSLYSAEIEGIKTGIPSLTIPMIKKVKIPIPPLSEQKRIVSILDRFDALVNDLSSGIPAEIEARQKQYEYYRDKLLTFREVEK